MTKRQVLAVATLAALPIFVATSQSPPAPVRPDTETVHTQMRGRDAGAQWMYAFGMEGEEALAFGIVAAIECSFFGPVGGLACGVTGAL